MLVLVRLISRMSSLEMIGTTWEYGNRGHIGQLVGGDWNMNGWFFHSVENFMIPTDEVHHFSEG